MTHDTPNMTPENAEPVVSTQSVGDPVNSPNHETVSLLGLARASTSGGQHFVPPSVDELAAALPQFDIEKLIGAGGMGAVYRVRQKGLDRVAALKVLPKELAKRPDFQERFMREAKALANLNHPHLVTVYEVGQTNGWCWLLMELVDGADLREVMSTGRLSPEQALRIVPQLCDALQYAHDQGVVHRDIKPENILLDTQGRLKLTDFGLAKIITKDDQVTGGSLTQTGAVMGTMHYMAPEQIEGAKVDHRTDIYAVGVVLYEMLTGGLPLGRFQPPSRQISVDVRIDDVVLKALDKDPEQRYQRASDVRSDVERVRSDAKSGAVAGGAASAAVRDGASTDGEGGKRDKQAKIVKHGESGMGVDRESEAHDTKDIGRHNGPRKILGITSVNFRITVLFGMVLMIVLAVGPGLMAILLALVGLMLVAGGWLLLTRRARGVVGESPDGNDNEIVRLLDRRIFRGLVMAFSGIATAGMCVFNEYYPRFDALWEMRLKIGDVPYTTDEIRFALSQLPHFMTVVGMLAGLAMVIGGWSLVMLRSQSLVTLGGIASFALVPVALSYPLRDGSEWPYAFIIALPVLYIPFFAFRKSKMADCFDPIRLAGIGYVYPSKGETWGWGMLLMTGLLVAIGVGLNESVKPLKRKLIDVGDMTFARDMETLELFDDHSAIRLSFVRSQYASLDRALNSDETLKKSLIEVGWSLEQHKKLGQVIAHLEDMRRREPSAALREYSRLWSLDELTWERLVRELCKDAREIAEETRGAIEVLESQKKSDRFANKLASVSGLPQRLEEITEWNEGMLRSIESLAEVSDCLGAVTVEEYRAQRDIILSLSDQTLQNPELLEAARKQLTKVWYSKPRADYLMMTIRQVSPYSIELHKWLEKVLRSRTTTTGLVFGPEKSIER